MNPNEDQGLIEVELEISTLKSPITEQLLLCAKSNPNAWISFRDLMVNTKYEKNVAIAHLKILFQQNILEQMPGNGFMANRYRLLGEAASGVITPYSETVKVLVQKIPQTARQVSENIAAIKRDLNESKKTEAQVSSNQENLKPRNFSGQFTKPGKNDSAIGALSRIELIGSQPIPDSKNPVMLLDLKRRPGSSRIAIALNDAIFIGQEAVKAILENEKNARKKSKNLTAKSKSIPKTPKVKESPAEAGKKTKKAAPKRAVKPRSKNT